LAAPRDAILEKCGIEPVEILRDTAKAFVWGENGKLGFGFA
jgi:hypothetical protein